MKTLIKELVFCLAVLLCVVAFAHGQNKPSPTFELVKETALKSDQDENGDYLTDIVVDNIRYTCCYLPRFNCIGISILNIESKIISIVLWDEETGMYERRVYTPEGDVVLDVMLSQETADVIAKRVLEMFGVHKSI